MKSFSATVGSLSEAWRFVLRHMDEVGPRPRITLTPIYTNRRHDMRLGKHTDLTGMALKSTSEIKDGMLVNTWLNVPVVEARGAFCEMCEPGSIDDPNNQAAEYTIDVVSVLGEGGCNQHYCQEHLLGLIRTSPDQWESVA